MDLQMMKVLFSSQMFYGLETPSASRDVEKGDKEVFYVLFESRNMGKTCQIKDTFLFMYK